MKRQSNLELLRVFAMLLIIAHHYAVHGGVCYSTTTEGNTWIAVLMLTVGQLGVDLFILISGYFLICSSFELMRIVRVEIAVLFYSVFFFVIACGYWKIEKISFLTVRNACLPSLTNLFTEYWFIPCYFAVVLLSPYINKMVNNIERKDYRHLLIILFLFTSLTPTLFQGVPVFDGNVSVFVMMYLIGGYYRKYNVLLNKEKNSRNLYISIVLYLVMVIATFVVKTNEVFFTGIGITTDPIWQKNSVLTVGLACLLFQFFLQLNMKNNSMINTISRTTIGIYLIHDNMYVRKYLWINILHTDRYYESKWLIVHALVSILGVFCVCAIFEFIRSKCMDRFISWLNRRKLIQRVNNIFRFE